MRVSLEADDSLAAEAAVAEFFACLAYVVRLNNGVNAHGDRAIGEHARHLGVRSVRSGHAEDPVAYAETEFSLWNAVNDTREVYAQYERILCGGRKPFHQDVIEWVDPGIFHAYKERAVRAWNRQVVERRSFAKIPDSECAHVLLLTKARYARRLAGCRGRAGSRRVRCPPARDTVDDPG